MRQNMRKLCTYRFYKTLDCIPLLNMIGLSERIGKNCQSIILLRKMPFGVAKGYYDITGTVPKNNVTFNTDFESKVMKWNLSKLHEKNEGKNITTQQWLNLFQSNVRKLPNEPRYSSLMYTHWLYKQYIKKE